MFAKRQLMSVVCAMGLSGAGAAHAALTYVFDTVAPPTPTPCSVSGTSYGNSVSCTSSTSPVPSLTSATGWANTGGNTSSSPNGTLQSAYVGAYSGGLGVTNQDGAGTSPVDPNEGTPGSTTPPEHAIDNNRLPVTTAAGLALNPSQYIYDSVLVEFASAITLTGVTIGWRNSTGGTLANDTDITVLAYTGGGGGTAALNGRTYAALTTSNDWKLVGQYADLALNTVQTINGAVNVDTPVGTSVSSKYWLIGAYNPLVGLGGQAQMTIGDDYVKLLSINGVVQSQRVPEPGSLVLLGLAGGAAAVARRSRSKKKVV